MVSTTETPQVILKKLIRRIVDKCLRHESIPAQFSSLRDFMLMTQTSGEDETIAFTDSLVLVHGAPCEISFSFQLERQTADGPWQSATCKLHTIDNPDRVWEFMIEIVDDQIETTILPTVISQANGDGGIIVQFDNGHRLLFLGFRSWKEPHDLLGVGNVILFKDEDRVVEYKGMTTPYGNDAEAHMFKRIGEGYSDWQLLAYWMAAIGYIQKIHTSNYGEDGEGIDSELFMAHLIVVRFGGYELERLRDRTRRYHAS